MTTSVENAFRAAVREHLRSLESQLVHVLGQLVRHPYPPEVFLLDFEVFSDSFTSQFPVRAFFMDRTNTEFFTAVNGRHEYPSPVDPDLIEVERVYPAELEDEVAAKDSGLDAWRAATEELVGWFHSCWEQAGGMAFTLRATIAEHDSSVEFNLMSAKWQARHAAFDASQETPSK
jgi:hypothetical protein